MLKILEVKHSEHAAGEQLLSRWRPVRHAEDQPLSGLALDLARQLEHLLGSHPVAVDVPERHLVMRSPSAPARMNGPSSSQEPNVRTTSRAIDQMLSATPDAVFEPFDQPSEVAVQLRGPLKRVEEFSVVDRRRLGLARLVVVDVTGHELTKQFTDRGVARGALEPLPGRIVDLDSSHVVTPLRSHSATCGLTGTDCCARSVAAMARHTPHGGAAPGGNMPGQPDFQSVDV